MKKNTICKVLFVLTLTTFALACKKENEALPVTPPPVTQPPATPEKPSLFANWDWIKTVSTGTVVETITPTLAGFNISLLLQKDSSFYVIKNAPSTNKLDTINNGKFKFVDLRINPNPDANPGSAPAADGIPTQITFNTNTPSPINISKNFDTIAIYTKSVGSETVDTYIRRK